MIMIVLGTIAILIGVADVLLITWGIPVVPVHDAAIIIVGGLFSIAIAAIRKYTSDDFQIPFFLFGLSVGPWSFATSELVAQLIVENWAVVLALALAQGPIVNILIHKTYGSWFRTQALSYMKKEGSLNDHRTRIAKRLVNRLPVEESAVYSIQASAVATALFMNEFGLTINSATTAAFLCATIIGAVFYTLHPSVDEIREFRKTPKEFF